MSWRRVPSVFPADCVSREVRVSCLVCCVLCSTHSELFSDMSGYLQQHVDHCILIFILGEPVARHGDIYLFQKAFAFDCGFDFKLKPWVPWTAKRLQ